MSFKRTLITTALPYANGPVHIGHLAGVYVPGDTYARYLRLQGREVMLVGGSDEHGVPVTVRARKEGCSPQDVVDRYHALIKRSFEEFGISFDVYSRTTSPTHHKFASDFFRTLYDKGELQEVTSEQYYDEEAHQFLADRYITGECPYCHAVEKGVHGDQCDNCGHDLSPLELINPKSTISSSKPVLRQTKNWYLPLNNYESWLHQWILEGHKEWRKNVYGQCKSWIDSGLQPRAMTRDLDWGIPVPIEGAEGKVLYVWFDAPIGYISNTVELCAQQPERWGTWQKWWQDPETRLIHFIGKDNIVFHCIIFPSMMRVHGDYIMPDNVPSNEFLNLEGEKISTSQNWAVWLHEYLQDFPGKQDVLRYVLTANAPETSDNDFTWKDFQNRNNNELVATLGNFVNRAIVLTHKYFEGVVPACGELQPVDETALEEIRKAKAELTECLETFHFRDGAAKAMEIARIGNRYLQETEPWKVSKTDMARTATILYVALQICGDLAIAFEPFLPFMSKKLCGMLCLKDIKWEMIGRTDIVPAGTQLGKAELLFEKIEDAAIEAQIQRLADNKKQNEINNWHAEPQAAEVDFDTFSKSDLRVGTVLECQKVPKADKLLQFLIDDGLEKRTIVSGIAKYYKPEDLVGKQVCFIANLPPRKLKGVISQGMLLSAVNADGSLVLMAPSGPVTPGAKIC